MSLGAGRISIVNTKFGAILVLVGLVAGTQGAMAQGQQPEEEEPAREINEARQEAEGFWNVSAILKMAVDNLGRRYNLNEEQKAYTSDMMTTRVTRFISEHQDEGNLLVELKSNLAGKTDYPGSAEVFAEACRDFILRLRDHLWREEYFIFPSAESVLGAEKLREIGAEMATLPDFGRPHGLKVDA